LLCFIQKWIGSLNLKWVQNGDCFEPTSTGALFSSLEGACAFQQTVPESTIKRNSGGIQWKVFLPSIEKLQALQALISLAKQDGAFSSQLEGLCAHQHIISEPPINGGSQMPKLEGIIPFQHLGGELKEGPNAF